MPAWLGALQGAGLALLAGCLGAYGRQVEAVNSGFVGMSGREVASCVGAPHETTEVDGVETASYYWELEPGKRPGQGLHRSPLLPKGTAHAEFVPPSVEVGYCEIVFQLRDGVVQSVSSAGKDGRGLSTAVDCLMMFRHCVAR